MRQAFLFIIFSFLSVSFAYSQKDFDENFPKDLKKHTLLVERIPLDYLKAELDGRDSIAIQEEYTKIDYIQDLYLVKEPIFPCVMVSPKETDRFFNSMPAKYRYVLKYRVVKKKIGKVREEVIGFYFRDLKEESNFKMLEDHNYNTKVSLVLIYGLIRKAYALPNE